MTVQPDPPLSAWFLVVLMLGGAIYLVARSRRHGRGLGVHVGVAAGSLFVLLLPSVAVGITQDLTCRDGGVLPRPDGGLMVVGVTAVALFGLLGLFWVSGDRVRGTGIRLAVIPPALLMPVAIVEVMVAAVPIEDYCDGLRGLLVLQAGLALLVPVAAVGLALVPPAPVAPPTRSRVYGLVVVALVAGLLPVQALTVAHRLRVDPQVCFTRHSIAAGTAGLLRGYTDQSVAAADFDGDGALDLGGVDASGAARVLSNDGRGGFTAGPVASLPTEFALGSAVAAGDMDGNGHPDLVITGDELVPPQNRRGRAGVAVVLNDGHALQPHVPLLLPGDDDLRQIAVGDLDGDGNVEVVVLDGGAVAVFWDRGGELEAGPRLTAPPPAVTDYLGQRRFELADADGDGILDVLAWMVNGSPARSYVVLHRNSGNRQFTSSVVATLATQLGGVAVADFDGDGDVDLVANGPERRLQVIANRGDGRFDVTTRPRRVGAEVLRPADVDNDGRMDLVMTTGFVSDEVDEPGFLWVRLNLGGFSFSDAQLVATPRTLLAIADLDGDSRLDFVVEDAPELVVLRSTDCNR